MKTKRLLFISCLAAGALIASPSFGKPAKKSAGMSQSKVTRVAPHTTQVMRHNQNISARMGGTRYYGGTRYTGTRSYAPGNIAGRVTTAARAITATITGAAPAITMGTDGATEALPPGRTSLLFRSRRMSPRHCGRTARTTGIIRTGTMGAVIRTVVTTTTTRTTRQRTAITDSMVAAVQRASWPTRLLPRRSRRSYGTADSQRHRGF